jgi:putative heme-binding domain-containing protein
MRLSFLLLFALACAGGSLTADPPFVATSPHRSPAEERASFRLPPGFEAQLVAAEPDIQKPINIAFDAKGRLWATCTIEYPYPAAEGKGRDTVKILEDFGPDGRARKVTTFADGLNIPIGVLPYQDGAIVYSIPNIWRLRDTDGDGKCDTREVLLSGFGHRDTHGMVNGFVLGFDGWVYACHGFSNDSVVKGKDGSEIRMNSGNTFRFKPDGSRVEMVCRGQVNPFGQCLDSLGNLYTACCHSKPITQLLRGAVYPSFMKPHDGLGFGPAMVHEYRGSTALCGLVYYDADHFPTTYHDTMFLGDVVNSCINVFDNERKGATYTAKQRKEDFLASSDPWFRPCDIKLGPDGALYVADFYNRIIGHYEVPLEHPGRDRTSGRIWRIVYRGEEGKPPPKAPRADWTKATVEDLIHDLNDPNLTVRMTATHQLVERGTADPRAGTIESVAYRVGYNLEPGAGPTRRAHALWVLNRLGLLDDFPLAAAANAEELIVRVHALRVLAERKELSTDQTALVRGRLADSDDLVRRVAADVLARHPSGQARDALLEARANADIPRDPFLLHTVRIALREQFRGQEKWTVTPQQGAAVADVALGLPESAAGNFLVEHVGDLREPRRRAAEFVHHAARYADGTHLQTLTSTVQADGNKDPKGTDPLVLSLVRGYQERGQALPAATTEWAVGRIERLLRSADGGDAQRGIDLALALNHRPIAGKVAAVGVDGQRPGPVRIAALNAVTRLDPKESVGVLGPRLIDASEPPALREAVAKALAEVNSADARTALANALPTAPARLSNGIAAGLAGTLQGASQLLDIIAAGKASPQLLTDKAVLVKLEASKLPGVKERVGKLTAGLPPADANIARLLRQRSAGYQKAKHDVAVGAKLYTQHCANCHQMGGQGAKVGPQLDGIGARGLERLLEDVLDPNRNVDQSFRATALTLKNGRQLSGLVLREEGQVVVLADAQGKEVRVEKAEIDQRETLPLSPMPANWGEVIAEKDLYDLLAYLLAQRGK